MKQSLYQREKYLIMDTDAAIMGKHHKLHDKQNRKKAQTGKENINITGTG